MGETASLEHGARVAPFAVEFVVAAIDIGSQDAGRCREMRLRMFAATITRVVEQGSWWIRSGEGTIVADVDP